jgi:hypothetical protein
MISQMYILLHLLCAKYFSCSLLFKTLNNPIESLFHMYDIHFEDKETETKKKYSIPCHHVTPLVNGKIWI